MSCERYLELLALWMDNELTGDEERELNAHLASCPDCRAAGAQLAALQAGFDELEDIPAPEGFARGVMDRVREAETEKKVIPLFKRPQFRALAGLAACLVLVVGLYSAAQPNYDDAVDFYLMTRSFTQDVIEENLDTPEIAAYADPGVPVEGGTSGMLHGAQKCAPDETAVYDGASAVQAAPMVSPAVLMLDRMPEGAWELIPPETPVSPEGVYVTEELFMKIEQLAQEEEGITVSRTTYPEAEEFIIVVLEETE